MVRSIGEASSNPPHASIDAASKKRATGDLPSDTRSTKSARHAQFDDLPERPGLDRLPLELLEPILDSLPTGSVLSLLKTCRVMHYKVKPEMTARKVMAKVLVQVLADARLVDSVSKLKLLLALTPLRQRGKRAPRTTENQLSNADRARVMVVLAGRLGLMPADDREEARACILAAAQSADGQWLVEQAELTRILDHWQAGPYIAAQVMIDHFGANFQAAADACGYSDLSPLTKSFYPLEDLRHWEQERPERHLILQHGKRVDEVDPDNLLDDDARGRLEVLAATQFLNANPGSTHSVKQVMTLCGLRSSPARQVLMLALYGEGHSA